MNFLIWKFTNQINLFTNNNETRCAGNGDDAWADDIWSGDDHERERFVTRSSDAFLMLKGPKKVLKL